MRKKMNKKIAACGALSAALLLAGCANDGTAYRSDVYWAGQVNQAQEVKTVQIIAVMPARITVDNRRDRSDSATMGTILGALAGAAVGAVERFARRRGGGHSGRCRARQCGRQGYERAFGKLCRGRSDYFPLRQQDLQFRPGRTRVRIQDGHGHHGLSGS